MSHLIKPTRSNSLLLAAIFSVVLISGCGNRGGGGGGGDDESAAPAEAAVPDVTVTKVEPGAIESTLTVNGNLSGPPNLDAKISAQVPGRISKLLVSEGDAVRAGQTLAELENAPLRDQERQAEAAVAQARASAENARLAAKRNEGLLQRGIAARKEVEDAQTQLAVNEGALRQAQAALSAARTQVGRAQVRAPFAGVVVRRFLGVGDQVDGSAALPIVEVANIDTLEMLGTVPASRLNELRPGKTFTFQTDSAPGVKNTATVVAVLPAVDPATNNGTVRIRIANPKHLLKVGQYLSIALPVKQTASQLVVPKQAIYPGASGEPHVYRVSGDQVESVAVKLGVQTAEKAEVLSGLNAGDEIVLTGGYGLPDKAKVHVKR